MLIDAGCDVYYGTTKVNVFYKHKLVWQGPREKFTGLWILPLSKSNQATSGTKAAIAMTATHHAAHNAYQMSTKEELIKYLHQCLFCPPKSTLLKAIKNNQLTTWPGLTAEAVEKYLPDSCPATDKGHMKRQQKGVRSTKEKVKVALEAIELERCMNPPMEEEEMNQIFLTLGYIDKKVGTVYADLTGRFPITSLNGMTAIFIMYDWTTNAILATPIKNAKAETIVECFKENITYLAKRGFKPKYNIIDNVATNAVKTYLESQKIKLQLVEPHNHRVNAAERAIQTFKNHTIAGLCICDNDFPSILWDKVIKQSQDTLNMLRTSRVHPKLSAFHVLEGQHDYNRVPFGPPGTRATIFNPPELRTSWGPRALDAWYTGPSWMHYRCMNFHVPSTGGQRTSAQFKLYPQHIGVPQVTPMDRAVKIATTLTQAIQKLIKEPTVSAGRHGPALEKLATIFAQTTTNLETRHTPTTQSSTTPTTPTNLRQTPRVHSRQTRHNTPGILPTPERVPTTTEGGHKSTGGTEPSSEGGQRNSEGVENKTERVSSSRKSKRTKPNSQNEPTTMDARENRRRKREFVREQAQRDASPTRVAQVPEEEPIFSEVPPPDQAIPNSNPAPNFRTPRVISQLALQAFSLQAMGIPTMMPIIRDNQESVSKASEEIHYTANIQHFCAPVIHPTTGEIISSYKKLAKDPEMKVVWETGFGKEWGSLCQGDKRTGSVGTNTFIVIRPDQVPLIPKDRTVTYANIVVDYRPQKEDPNRVRITAGGNLIIYPGELTTRTADITTSKILWNSVLSTAKAKYMCMDIKNFYLCAPMDRYEYMKMPLSIFPQHVVDEYGLQEKAYKGYVWLEVRRSIYGLPQAGKLANEYLRKKLAPKGYYEVPHTPGLWKHISRPIQFTLVVDDFGVKYTREEDALHLLSILKHEFTDVSTDWDGKLYCGISLDWNYEERWVDISMPGYIKKMLEKYKHESPPKPQHSPYVIAPKKYGKDAHDPIPQDDSPPATAAEVKRIQGVIGSILYYARSVDPTFLVGLNSLAMQQSAATGKTISRLNDLLDYAATHPDAKIRYRASDMILQIHSDASYLSEPRARSRAAGHYFLGWLPQDDRPIRLNGGIYTLCTVLKFVASSAAEAELGALFLNVKEGRVLRLTLEEMGHPQPPTPIHCDNSTAVGIANETVKKHRSRPMEMRYFYSCDQVKRKNFAVHYHPGLECLGDYPSKHHITSHHVNVRPIYLHTNDSPLILPRAPKPSDLRGCVGKTVEGYKRGRPLPVLPRIRPRLPRGTQIKRVPPGGVLSQ